MDRRRTDFSNYLFWPSLPTVNRRVGSRPVVVPVSFRGHRLYRTRFVVRTVVYTDPDSCPTELFSGHVGSHKFISSTLRGLWVSPVTSSILLVSREPGSDYPVRTRIDFKSSCLLLSTWSWGGPCGPVGKKSSQVKSGWWGFLEVTRKSFLFTSQTFLS